MEFGSEQESAAGSDSGSESSCFPLISGLQTLRLKSLQVKTRKTSTEDDNGASLLALRKRRERAVKGPLGSDAKEVNRIRSLKYRQGKKSASESEGGDISAANSDRETERSSAKLRKQKERSAKGPLSDDAKEVNRIRSLKYRQNKKSANESDGGDTSAANSDLEAERSSAKLRKQKERSAKGPLSGEKKETNRLRCVEFRLRGKSGSNNDRNLCPHCHQEGHHQPFSATSCPNYCTYCNVVAHNIKKCRYEQADRLKAANMSKDAADYKVIFVTKTAFQCQTHINGSLLLHRTQSSKL